MNVRATALVALAIAAAAASALWLVHGFSRPRVLLIGIDGADPAILKRLIDAGRLPTFARLRRVGQFARIYATTEYYRRIAGWLQRKYRPELLGVYFEAIDACGHLFMEDAPPRRPQIAAEDYAAFSETIERCYEYQDEVLSDVLAMTDDRTLTIICSDHGFKSGDRRPDTPGRADEGQAALWH